MLSNHKVLSDFSICTFTYLWHDRTMTLFML